MCIDNTSYVESHIRYEQRIATDKELRIWFIETESINFILRVVSSILMKI